MPDTTRFETRLTDALERYADRMSVDVDPKWLVGTLVARPVQPPRRFAFHRARLALAVVLVAVISVAGLAFLGGRLLAPVPPVVVSSSPSMAPETAAPTTTTSPSPDPTASRAPTATPVAALSWTERDIPSQPDITSIWRVGDWFIAVGPRSSFANDQHVDAAFLRSPDGQAWETIPPPARGMEVETGAVDGDVLWIVGRLGTSADPRRGMWTTQDGATWQRVANVKGLDFGPGGVDTMSHASAGWLAMARRWIDAESQETFMLRSADGVAWTKSPYPDPEARNVADGLASDGDRWLMVTAHSPGTGSEVWAFTSSSGIDWTEARIASMARGPGAPAAIEASAVTFGPGGFVVVGQQLEGEYPHAIVWVSPDGEAWTEAATAGLPDPAGETGLNLVVAFDGGYLASGYRLNDSPSFWTSVDGSSWAQVDDLFGGDEVYVQALGASDATYVAGGQTSDGGAFLWTAPH